MSSVLPLEVEIKQLLYTGKYLPPIYFRPFRRRLWANVRLGKIQCLKLSI